MVEINNPPPEYHEPQPQPQPQPQQNMSRPAVSAPPAKTLVFLVGFVGIIALILVNILTGDDEPPPQDVTQTNKDSGVATATQTPMIPPPILTAPELPPAVVPVPEIVPPGPGGDVIVAPEADSEARLARIKSNMVVVSPGFSSGGSSAATNNPQQQQQARQVLNDDPNAAFANAVLATSDVVERTEATRIGNPNSIIAQGKIIDAVLETALNTDLPGVLRAVVTRNIYAESGRLVLLPKGSRLIGSYNTDVRRGQKRVLIVWTRVIRPDGVDLALGSPGIDRLGRSGVEGIVDNKFMEIFSSAILTSTLTIAVALAVDKAVGEENSSVTQRNNTDGSSERSGTATAQAASRSVENMGSTAENFINEYIDVRPTIMVDQGTIVKVFVNRDLIFPEGISKQVNLIR